MNFDYSVFGSHWRVIVRLSSLIVLVSAADKASSAGFLANYDIVILSFFLYITLLHYIKTLYSGLSKSNFKDHYGDSDDD